MPLPGAVCPAMVRNSFSPRKTSFDFRLMSPETSKTTVRGPAGFDRLAQRAGPGVVEVGDVHHAPAAPADGESSVSLGGGEGEMADTEVPDIATRDLALGIDRIDPPGIVKQRVVGHDGCGVGAAFDRGQKALGVFRCGGELAFGSRGITVGNQIDMMADRRDRRVSKSASPYRRRRRRGARNRPAPA